MIINGNLKFHTAGSGELQNAIMENLTTVARDALGGAAGTGRLIFNTTDNVYNFYDGTIWLAFATGGNTAALETEINAIETASGGIFATDGTFDGTGLDAFTNVAASSSLLNALGQLDAAISAAAGVDTLGELSDVTLATVATNDTLIFTGAVWANRTPAQVQSHLSLVPGTDVQAFDADLTEIAALVNTTGDVLYTTGAGAWAAEVPGAISGVQAYDAGLDSLAGLAAGVDSLIYSTGTDAYATSSLTSYARTLLDDVDAVAARATLGTVIGTDVQAFDTDLAEIAALVNGIGDVLYTNGTGNWVAAGPGTTSGVQAWDLNLDEVAALTPLDSTFIVGNGTSWVAETGAVVRTSLDVYSTTQADSAFVDVTGDTMSGNLNMGTNSIVSLSAPTADTDAANKAYVDALVSGLTWKNSAVVATTSSIADLSAGPLIVDSVTLVAGDRVLVKDTASDDGINALSAKFNGVYIVGTIGANSGAWTRATDFDSVSPIDEINSAAIFVEQGTIYQDTGWTVTSDVAIVDTDDITFTQFNGASGITAGIGLVKSGNTLDINMGAGIVALPSDEVGIDLYEALALHLTENGTTDSVGTAAQLALFLDGTTLSQSVAGLKVPSQGITETELNVSIAGNGLAGGGGTALSVNVDDSSIEIVTDTLQVKAAGVTNTMLANSTLTMDADVGTSDVVALGETFSILGGTLATTTVDPTLNKITIDVAANVDDLGDVDTTSVAPTNGDTLVWNGTNWVPGNPINSSDELTDVTAAATADGEILVSDGTNYTPQLIHHVYTGISATSHVVAHSLGQQFVNVTVIDSANSVIIPQSIVMDNANQLTVVFNTAIVCKVIVTGV